MPIRLKFVFLFLTAAALGPLARAEVKLPALFSDNMVLQRDKPVAVWGWAGDGEAVTVELNGKTASTKAVDGKWLVHLPKLKAGGPHRLEVRGENTITLNNVLVGEVWICSGQSNMEWPIRATFEPEKALASARNNNIRVFTVPKLKAAKPEDDVEGKWAVCSPTILSNFSAVAYYFGRDLQKAIHVPIGLIHTSWGGSPAEVWLRQEVLEENPQFKKEILDPAAAAEERHREALAKWEQEKAALESEGKKTTRRQPNLGWRPAELYNGMIAPLVPFSIRGAIWYQGESNAGRAHQYRALFPAMIQNWREDFGQGDFPFLLVQLAPWDKNRKRDLSEIAKEPVESDWAELREAQLLSTKTLPNVAIAVITDFGDKDDIHPARKEPVGQRLALAARAVAYKHKITYSGPVYRSMVIEGDKAIISFDSLCKGLVAKGGPLTGFAIAGADRKFLWANAEIREDKVVVSHPDVPRPVAVRHGWADFPVVNLYNTAGLPASPFRTDNFPMVTGPKVNVNN